MAGEGLLDQAWLQAAIAQLGNDPLLQGVLAALATFILEDPTTIACGLLVADGRMAFSAAFLGLTIGIAVGDVGLYAAGRLFGNRLARWGWVSQERLDRGSAWFQKNVVSAVLLSRFAPGTRFATYVAAGVLRAPLGKFALIAVLASVIWTALLLSLTVTFGEIVMPVLGRLAWPMAFAAIAIFILLQRRAARKAAASVPAPADETPIASVFEFWSPWLFYIPVAAYCALLSLRYRGLTLPTVANPSIYSGGLIGESKSEILDLVVGDERHWIVPYTLFDPSGETDRLAAAKAAIARAGLAYPLVAKPDIGQKGSGVRPVRSDADLKRYLDEFPDNRRIVLQTFVGREVEAQQGGEPGRIDVGPFREAGVLYWRMPGAKHGSIFSLTLKAMPFVTGDGKRTFREIIEADPRASRIADIYLDYHAGAGDRVLKRGETLPMVFVGNHCRGAVFRDATSLATPQLLARCEQIADAMPEFYFGRFDVRFDDMEAFLRGEDFKIIEINGAGSEAVHIWDASVKLGQAYATLFKQFRILFEIGAANRKRGYHPLGIIRVIQDALGYRQVARHYPQTY